MTSQTATSRLFPAPLCPCGCSAAHKIAHRQTADGIRVTLWSDGTVTSGMGFCIRGIGAARSNYEAEKDVEAGWLAFAEIELYDLAEVSRLVRAARKAVRQRSDTPQEAMIRYYRGENIRTMKAGRTFRWVKGDGDAA